MEKYAALELEVIEFNTEDIISTSGPTPGKDELPIVHALKPYEIYEADESDEDY